MTTPARASAAVAARPPAQARRLLLAALPAPLRPVRCGSVCTARPCARGNVGLEESSPSLVPPVKAKANPVPRKTAGDREDDGKRNRSSNRSAEHRDPHAAPDHRTHQGTGADPDRGAPELVLPGGLHRFTIHGLETDCLRRIVRHTAIAALHVARPSRTALS